MGSIYEADYYTVPLEAAEEKEEYLTTEKLHERIGALEERMKEAARKLEFEKAAELRDEIKRLKHKELGIPILREDFEIDIRG